LRKEAARINRIRKALTNEGVAKHDSLNRKSSFIAEGLADRMRKGREELALSIKAGTYKPIEDPRLRGMAMREALKKEGILL